MYYQKSIILLLLCIYFLGGCTYQITTDIELLPSVLLDHSDVDTLVDLDEKNLNEIEMRELALTYKALYEEMDKGTDSNAIISEECVMQIIEQFAKNGYTATGYYQNMVNYQRFEDFLLQALEGQEGYANFYYVRSDGGFFRMDFHSVDKRLFLTTASLAWDDATNPFIVNTNQYIIDKWNYTDKGYFIYETNDDRYQYSLQRVKPLGERERELCNSYIRPIGYQGNNLFLIDWDQSSMNQIVFNDLYEYLYFMETGKLIYYELKSVSAEEFELLFVKYFNITTEFLRKTAIYYNDSKEYFWENLSCDIHYILYPAPEPEVVGSWENEDGTITMVVDAVDDFYGKDRAFTHEVTVLVDADGNFQYVSNHIRSVDKENVPSYIPRSEH